MRRSMIVQIRVCAEPWKNCGTFSRFTTLKKHRAWFLENGLISSARSRAVTREVESLCAEVRSEAVALVDAFGIPPECLAAPIALD